MKTSVLLAATAIYTTSAFHFPAFAPRHNPSKITNRGITSGRTDIVSLFSTETTDADTPSETYQFDAEVSRVMDIIINSLYSDKSVFLRELTSNAADALDKRRFLSLTEAKQFSDGGIKIKTTPDTLTITDNGIGMTKEELVTNLGRIANSGTRKFSQEIGKNDDTSLIGQFGVGFYSGFLVADKMIVETSRDGGWHKWESEAGEGYTVVEVEQPKDMESQGTRLTLHLKKDCLEYAKSDRLEELLSKYSSFIDFPIELWTEKTEYNQVPDPEDETGEKKKTVPEKVEKWELMNTQKPLWLREPREVEDDEYSEFYKSTFKSSYDDPMKWTHFKLEGQVELKSLLYIPGMLPFELSKNMFDEDAKNLKLYVKRVFINDDFEDLIPRYLKFIRGIVDSDDLELNVGREILQKSRVLSVVRKRLVRKSLDMIKDLKESGDYDKFWTNFGKYIKVGVVEDEQNIEELSGLCLWTMSDSEKMVSLDEYVSSMKEGQDKIYYISGDSKAQCLMNPAMEALKKKGYEAVLCVEPLDEIAVQTMGKFNDKDIVDATKEQWEDEDDKAQNEKETERLQPAIDYLRELLGKKVADVGVTTSLTSSPSACRQGQYGMSPSMQRYMQAQAVALGEEENPMLGNMNEIRLELNPSHSVVNKFSDMVAAKSKSADAYGELLFDLAMITSGYGIEDAKGLSERIVGIMEGGETDGVSDAVVVG